MPFQDLHLEYFKEIIVPAAAEVGLIAKKADDIFGTKPIIQDIWDYVWAARAVIADVTGKNPNVNYELGLCHALGIPTVLITQSLDDVPFDYRHRRCIPYDVRRVNWQEKLRRAIASTLKTVLSGEDKYEELKWPYDTGLLRASRRVGSFVSAEEAMDPVLRGISIVRDAVASAYGPHGSTVSVAKRFGDGQGDRSGLNIAQATDSADPIERKGIERTRMLARELYATTGDGSKTAILLFRELVSGGFAALKQGAIPRDLINDMNSAVDEIIEYLRKGAWPIKSEGLLPVARSAAAGDQLSSKIVTEAVRKSGLDGLVYLENSPDSTTTVLYQEGMYFDRGLLSHDFITDEVKQLAILSQPYILICNFKISSMKDLLPAMELIARRKESLLLIADDVDGEALATLAINNQRGTLPCAAVRAPGTQQTRQPFLEDIATATGATIIDGGIRMLENVAMPHFGRAERIEISKDSTWIIRGRGDSSLVRSRAATIRQQITLTEVDSEREKLKVRLAKLVGATCAIRIGGVSTVDREERRYRIETAMHSSQAALQGGVIAGGGAAFLKASAAVTQSQPTRAGYRVVSSALTAPIKAQLKNAKVGDTEAINEILKAADSNMGFNAESRNVENLEKAGVLDPVSICINGLQIAFAHARAVLQVGAWDLTERSAPAEIFES